jgi:IS6 family transposase
VACGSLRSGIAVDPATINRWVVKFSPDIAKSSFKHLTWRCLTWHVDETYKRVGGKWSYRWRAAELRFQLIDFGLTTGRDAKAPKAFLRQEMDIARFCPPKTTVTDKAPTCTRIIGDIRRPNFLDVPIPHVDREWRNNMVESDCTAPKRLSDPVKAFQ